MSHSSSLCSTPLTESGLGSVRNEQVSSPIKQPLKIFVFSLYMYITSSHYLNSDCVVLLHFLLRMVLQHLAAAHNVHISLGFPDPRDS